MRTTEPTAEDVIEAARKRWPEASGIKLESPRTVWLEAGGKLIAPWRLVRYTVDCDGDELGSSFTADTLSALLQQIESPDDKP